MTHHDAQLNDEGFHEIQLSGKQLVFLFMATATVLVVTFLCGVQVGRNVRTPDRPVEQADSLSSVIPPAASPAQAQPAAGSSGPPASEPPAPAQEPEDELSYAKRLQADNPPAEKLKAPSPPAAAPTSGAKAATPAAETPAKPALATPAAQKPAATAQSAGRPGAWIVQLTALQDRGAATAIVRRLAGRGYPAFVLDPAAGSPGLYRVQVGGYADRAGAEQAARRLEKEEQFKPYVRAR
jgi:DedD protein